MSFTFINLRAISLMIATGLVLVVLPVAGSYGSPAGLWKTFDDRTHKARGVVRIFEENGALSGRIESSFIPEEEKERCDKCSGDRKGAPIIGLVIMRGVRKHGSEYEGGDILDPETGSIYKCKMTLSSDGEKLFVRGYLGLSLLGRTQTWVRMKS